MSHEGVQNVSLCEQSYLYRHPHDVLARVSHDPNRVFSPLYEVIEGDECQSQALVAGHALKHDQYC